MRNKEKISITLDKGVLALIDEEVEAGVWENRSNGIETFCFEHYDLSIHKERMFEFITKLSEFLERHPQHRERFRAVLECEVEGTRMRGGARSNIYSHP